MRYLVIIALLIGCNEVELKYKNCFDMTIPQGNPVKFWLNGVESFNEKVVPGITQVCFHQKFKDDDVVKIQIMDYTGLNYSIKIFDKDDVELGAVLFTETSGVYLCSFSFSDFSIDETYVKLKLYEGGINAVYTDWSSPLSTWALVGVTFETTLPNNFSSHLLRIPFNVLSGDTVTYSFNVLITDGGNGVGNTSRIIVSLTTGGAPSADLEDFQNLPLGSQVISGSIVASADRDHFWISASAMTSNSYARGIEVTDIDCGGAEQAKSDLLYIADDDETYLIQYSNESNFAGLDYSAGTIFGVRVHSSFFKERFPEEDESEEISDGSVVKLSGSVKNQRLLQIEPAPFYFHNLLKRVLQHNTIYIDGMYWEKEESYEITEINSKYPLQKGEVWLTQKEDGYDTNVYGTLTNL